MDFQSCDFLFLIQALRGFQRLKPCFEIYLFTNFWRVLSLISCYLSFVQNKCNVGYAFINMTSPTRIVPFYKAFNGKKWEKFNSEKVASLAYARIQGKAALVAHFQNSSLMNEDKRCRPILFHSEGPHVGDQVDWHSVLQKSLNNKLFCFRMVETTVPFFFLPCVLRVGFLVERAI